MRVHSDLSIRVVRRILAGALSFVLVAQPVLADFAEPGRTPELPTIRIIQDIHAHAEAQRSIAASLARLQKQAGRDLRVGVEGAAGPFDFSPYYAFPDDNIRREVASRLVDENLLAGPAYAALCRPVFRLFGIEDPSLYRDNVQAYLSSRESQPRLLKAVADRKSALARRKAATFGPSLAAFDAKVGAYRAGDFPFGDYLEAVSAAAGDTGLSVEQFLVAHRMERSIDFNRVEAERKTFVERLVRSLSESDVAQVRQWIEGLGEDSGAGRRFEFLFHAARARGIDLSAFPRLTDYVRYIRLSEGVDPDRLFTEAAAAEEAAYRRLCATSPEAAALVSEERRLHLTEKLLRFEMTHEDWRAFQRVRPAGTELPETDLRPFEDFYLIASKRDEALAARARRGGLDAIVVGGFHTEGLTSAFRDAGIPFEIVRPKITSALPGDANAYLSVFAAEKTPLERLFSRFRLFLAPPEVIGDPNPLVASRKDRAPQRWRDLYRVLTVKRPDLADRVASADSRLDAALGKVSRLNDQFNRPNFRWLTETGLLLALALGVAIGNDGVSAAGIAVQLFGLPLLHTFTVDRSAVSPARRFAERTVWSAAFLGVYGAAVLFTVAIGMPLWIGAFLALLPAAFVHRLNHVAVLFPGSVTATLLFDVFKLPVLRMSTSSSVISPDEQPLMSEYGARMMRAVDAWRSQGNKLEPGIESDPVTELIYQTERDLLGKEERYKVIAMLGLAIGLVSVRLTIPELRVRSTRDFAAVGVRAATLDATSEEFKLNSNVTTVLYRQTKVAYTGGTEFGPAADVIEAGRTAGIVDSMRRLMRDAIGDWRANRRADDLGTGDGRIEDLIKYAQLAADNVPAVLKSLSGGLAQGVIESRLTEEELAARARADTARSGWVRKPPEKPRIQAAVYGAVSEALKGQQNMQDALYQGLDLGIRDAAVEQFNGVIARWRASGDDVLARDPSEILGFYQDLFGLPPTENGRRLVSIAGVAVAYGSAGLTREEMIHVAYADTLFAFSRWFNLGGPEKDPVFDGINSMLDQLAVRDAATGELMKIGREQGWYAAMQRNAGESVRRMRKEVRGPIALPSELVKRLIPIMARFRFPVRATADSVAKGFLLSELTPTEALGVVSDMLVPVLEGPPFRNDTSEFTVAGAIVNAIYDGSETRNAVMHQAIGLALDEYFNPSAALKRLLGELKAKPEDAGISRRIANVWIRVPSLRKRTESAAEAEELVEAMFEADLSPELLSRRAHADLGVQIARFIQRPLSDAEVYWPEKVQDPAIQDVIDVYVRLARRYHAEGATERVAGIFEGLALAANDPLLSDGFKSSVYQLKYTLPLNDIANAALELDQPDTALACARIMAGTAEISYELPEIVTWIYTIMGRAYLEKGDPDSAMLNGYEYAVASTYQDLFGKVVDPAEWAAFMGMASQYALLFERQAGHSAAGLIYRWMVLFLNQHPTVAARVNPDLMNRVRAMSAVTAIATYARPVYDVTEGKFDPEKLAQVKALMEQFDEFGLEVMRQTSLPPLEKSVFLQAALDVNTEACFLGDPARLARALELGRLNYADQPLLLKDAELRARRNFAVGRPADRARIFSEIDAVYAAEPVTTGPATSLDDVLFKESFAMYQAVKGNFTEAERLLREVDAAVLSTGFRVTLGDTAGETPVGEGQEKNRENADHIINKLRVLVLSQMAGIMSGRNAPASDIAPVLQEAFSLPGYDLRVADDLVRFLEPGTFRKDVLIEAAGVVITALEKGGAGLLARLSLLGWARQVDLAGVAARREAWTTKSRAKDFRKAIAERMDLLDGVQPGEWPAKVLLLVDHTHQMEIRERQFAAALEGLDKRVRDNYKIFQQRLQTTRLFLHIYAATLASAQLPKQSLEVIRFGRQALLKGIRLFVPDAKLKLPEDIGVILFPTVGGDHLTTVNEAKQSLTPDDTNKVAVIGPYALAAAENVANQEGFESPRDLKDALDSGIALVGRIRSAIPVASAEYTIGRLRLYLGDFPGAQAALRKAIADASPNGRSSGNRARAELASFSLRDNQRLLPARLNEAERLLEETKANLDYNQAYVGYLEIVISLFRYNPADAEAAPALVRRVMELINFAFEHNEVRYTLGYGFAFRAAEAVLAVGPRSGAEIIDALARLEPMIGPKTSSVVLAQRMISDLYEHPAAFLTWIDSEHASEDSPDWTGVRLVAADRANHEDRAASEAERLVSQRPAQYADAYWLLYVTEVLMESPTMRAAYLRTVMPMLTTFTPTNWTGKDRTETLRRLIEVAANLGDPEVVYVLDALAENKSFPLRDNLSRKDVGLLARLEPSLHTEEWIERISRMEHLNPARMALIQKSAEARMRTEDDGTRLRLLLEEKRTGFEARQAAIATIAEARLDYRALELNRAHEKLTSIEVRFRNTDWTDLNGQVERLLRVWSIYQRGNFDQALAALEDFPDSESVPMLLRNRILMMAQARRELEDHRPQAAEVTLNAINGTLVDDQKAQFEAAVRKADVDSKAAFESMKREANKLPDDASAIDGVRRYLHLALSIDAEFQSVMRYIITKSQTLADLGKTALAEDLLTMLSEESRLFDSTSPSYTGLAEVRIEFDRFRALARARYMKNWLNIQLKVLRAEYEANEYRESRTSRADTTTGSVKQQRFHLGEWELVDGGFFTISSLSREVQDGNQTATREPKLEAVPLATTEFFQSGATFQLVFPISPERRDLASVTFLRRDRGNRLLFAADPASSETIRQMQATGRKVGTMKYVEDLSLLAKINALQETINYLDRQSQALAAGRLISTELRVVNRLLGLDVSVQPSGPVESGMAISERFQGDPTQLGAIYSAINPKSELTAIQGPPGTGKTATAVEIVRQLTAGSRSKPGRVVVITSQAHAGVDNIALRLREAGVTIVRSASAMAQEKVDPSLRTEEIETTALKSRLDQLMTAMDAHEANGTGFAYLVTNSGLRGDKKCFTLFSMYLAGAPMAEIRYRYLFFTKRPMPTNTRGLERHENPRAVIRPVWGQEEAGQANAPEVLAIVSAIRPDKAFMFGDQNQLSPHPIDDGVQAEVEEEIRRGLTLSVGPVARVFTPAADRAMATSLFKVAYDYAEKWKLSPEQMSGAGILLHFLAMARRSNWIITDSIVNVFYGERLLHRDHAKEESDWERVTKETVVFVNSAGQERKSRERESVRDVKAADARGPQSTNRPSVSNFTEVGETIRAATHHLNSRSPLSGRRREPGDILILTPYRGQQALLEETLRIVATLNDLAAGETVAADEMQYVTETLTRHASDARFSGQRDLHRTLGGLQRGDRRANVRALFNFLKPMYDVVYDGSIQISRSDLPKKKDRTPPDGPKPSQEAAELGLSEQNANVIRVATIHSVQGQERPVVIVSFARSQSLGFLDEDRSDSQSREIINVALSRVQEQLVVIYSNNLLPQSVVTMIPRLKANFLKQGVVWNPITRFPSSRSGMGSLRQAWNVSLGSDALNRFVDTKLMPIVETGLFLILLGVGLMHGNAVLAMVGLLMKTIVFPMLHLVPGWLGINPDAVSPGQASMLFRLAAVLTTIYLASYFLMSAALIAPAPAMVLAMIPVVLKHWAHNDQAGRLLQEREARPLEIDALSGVSALRPERIAADLVPPVKRAPDPSFRDARLLNSGS